MPPSLPTTTNAHIPVDAARIVGRSALLGEMRDGKGEKDRITLLPPGLVQPFREQMAVAQARHRHDLAAGLGEICLPYAIPSGSFSARKTSRPS